MNDKEMNMNFKIPSDVVESAVKGKINAAIASELGDPAAIINKFVEIALAEKVDVNGKKDRYSSSNNYSFIDAMAGKLIRDAAEEALKEYFADNKEAIKNAVKKEVAKSPAKMAKVFMDGITRGMEATYSSSINITFENKDRY
ncbi:MAG: hypothetical protein V3V40_06445 [Nitrosomonadaceae bacterium]